MAENTNEKSDEERRRILGGLFGISQNDYHEKGKYGDHLLEQYKMYVEMADKISERRSIANSFFLSLNGFLLSVLGVIPQIKSDLAEFNLVWVVAVAVAGIVFCRTWITTIKNYAKLNEAKFTIIGEIEKKLPVAVYDTEWKYLKPEADVNKSNVNGRVPKRYFPLTRIEARVPQICMLLYVGMIIGWYLVFAGVIQASP